MLSMHEAGNNQTGEEVMVEIGRVCVKIAGRDAGRKCVVIDVQDKNFVMIDGETRRKRCNSLHLEPLSMKLDIKKNASSEEVRQAFKSVSIEIKERKIKEAKEHKQPAQEKESRAKARKSKDKK